MLAPESGLCPECASSADTADPTLRSSAPPDPEPPTANPVPPSTGPFAATGSFGIAADTGSNPTAAPSFPHAPAGYELLDRLGGGGMGEVYLARESTSERLVAMKFLRCPGSPDALERFLVELRAMARIEHPNVVRVLASDFLRSDPFFTMEHMPNGSLTGRSPLPPAEAVKIVRAVAEALAAAHAEQIIHRDLKPSNILLAADGTPKLSDFGLAKFQDADPSLTLASGALGTVQYMPPEQVTSRNGKIGPWSDVFGLGATLYHLLSGHPPFTGETSQDIILKVVSEQPPRLHNVPLVLEGIVLKCLEKETEDRYQSMAALIADLDAYLAEKPNEITAKPLTRWRRAKRWAKRNRREGVKAVLLVAGMFVLGAAYWQLSKPPDPLVEIQKELAAGRKVVLIPSAGKPRWHHWLLGAPELTASPTGDGSCSYEANGYSLLELCPDPMTDRYLVRAKLRFVEVKRRDGEGGRTVGTTSAGVYFGRNTLVGNGGLIVHALFGVTFSDMPRTPPQSPPGQPPIKVPDNTVRFRAMLVQQRPDSTPSPSVVGGPWAVISPSDNLPGPWRTIEIEVTPDRVRARWEGPDGKMADFADLSGDAVRASYADLRQKLDAAAPGHGVQLPDWAPRAPLGIWNLRSTIDVKDVSVTPLN